MWTPARALVTVDTHGGAAERPATTAAQEPTPGGPTSTRARGQAQVGTLSGKPEITQPLRRLVFFEQSHFVDMARKVVGVGSVGTRCWVVLFTGRDADDPLLLQIKAADQSVSARFLGTAAGTPNQGQRVVTGQRLMQQASDLFLGWQRQTGIDQMRPEGMELCGEVCAWCLARAHARSGYRIAIAGYLGSSTKLDTAIADITEAYADLNDIDHQQLTDAVTDGRLKAGTGVQEAAAPEAVLILDG